MPVTLELHDEPLITTDDPASKGDGRHLVREAHDGIEIYAHVEGGEITGFSARRQEQGLSVVRATLQDLLVDGELPPPIIYLCFTWEGRTTCFRVGHVV